jgi:hypothetical protein
MLLNAMLLNAMLLNVMLHNAVQCYSMYLKSLSSLLEMVPLPPPGGPRMMVLVAVAVAVEDRLLALTLAMVAVDALKVMRRDRNMLMVKWIGGASE